MDDAQTVEVRLICDGCGWWRDVHPVVARMAERPEGLACGKCRAALRADTDGA